MFDDVIEEAKSARSSCRQCRRGIEKGALRFGADESGFYGDGSSYSWFHLKCGAQRMPDRLANALKKEGPSRIPDFASLLEACEKAQQKAASTYPYGERAPTSRARCMKCQKPIEKGAFRVAVEREINAGSFVQTGAGYLHPGCAVEQLNEPNLGEVLKRNSPLLSAEEKDALAAMCPVGPVGAATVPVKRTARRATAPESGGEELVYADELQEKGDPRGELIVVAEELAKVGIDDPRGLALAARAKKLMPAAKEAWAKDIGRKKTQFTLEDGLPSNVRIKIGKTKLQLPEHRWIVGYRVEGATGAQIARLLAATEFERVRHLVLEDSTFEWDEFRDFCASPAVKHLRSLEITVNVGARGVHMLLMATRFEALERLELSSNYQATPNLTGYEKVAGLPALRTLHLRDGATAEMVSKLLRSPLAQRLEELGVIGWAWPKLFPELPNLRRLRLLGGALLAPSAASLTPANLPSLRLLDLTESKTDAATLKKLRAAFGDRVIAKEPTRGGAKRTGSSRR
jgi:hypothetical protein